MRSTIKARLFVGFLSVALVTGVVGVLGYLGLKEDIQEFSDLLGDDVTYSSLAHDFKIDILQHRRFEKDYLLNIGDAKEQKRYLDQFKASGEALRGKAARIIEMTREDPHLAPELKLRVEGLAALYEAYRQGFMKVAEQAGALSSMSSREANALMTSYKDSIHRLESLTDEIYDAGNEMVAHVESGVISRAERSKTMVLGFVGFGVFGAMLVGFIIHRSISHPLLRVASLLNDSSSRMSSNSELVSSASQHVASGSSQQAASVEETSSALEELTAMTRRNAENAAQTDQLMKQAGEAVQESSESMKALASSMDDISTASEETRKIVRTIDEIAFQTNLLALNAAVEAARAGEAGAGFAVVADEVRNLAMRAAAAAKNTASLIENTMKRVSDGVSIVNGAQGAFIETASKVKKMGELVEEITVASMEQSRGIEQINIAMNEIDKATQENAAGSEEVASAAEEMMSQSIAIEEAAAELGRLASVAAKNGESEAEVRAPRPGRILIREVASRASRALAGPIPAEPLMARSLDGF